MLRLVAFTAILLPSFSYSATGQQTIPAALSGYVKIDAAGDRVPARRARVTLTRQSDGQSFTTATGREGEYSISDVPAGRYAVSVEKAGFVTVNPRFVTDLAAGVGSTLDVLMQRGGVLEGRILNYLRNPIGQLTVIAEPVTKAEADDGSSTSKAASVLTDDLGRFRVHSLRPGRYRIHAPGTGLYYPGTDDQQQAAAVAVTVGQVVGGLDVVVPAAPIEPVTPGEPLIRVSPQQHAAREEAMRRAGLEMPVRSKGSSSIEGRVIRTPSGEPIVKATLTIAASTGAPFDSVVSDDEGRYAFTDLPPGAYSVTARAHGFVNVAVAGSSSGAVQPQLRVTLKDGERREQANLEMALPGAIEGRIQDEFGDPATGVIVQVARPSYPGLSRQPVAATGQEAASAPTDDRGWFRIAGLAPGDYYVMALPEPFHRSAPAGFALTFFPGTNAFDGSTLVRLVAGADTLETNFGLAPARTTDIEGIVQDPAGRPAAKARIVLLPVYNGEVRTTVIAPLTADVDGSFKYPQVPDGTYVLQASAPRAFGMLPVTVTGIATREPLRLVVPTKPLVSARGRVVFDGNAPRPRTPVGVQIHFIPTDFTSGPVGWNALVAQIKADWTFELTNLAWDGLIRATLTQLPSWTLVRVTLNGKDITDTPYDFRSSDVNGLEVVLSSRTGRLSGTVTDGGKPAAEASVLVFGEGEDSLIAVTRVLRLGSTDQDGAFTIPNLVAGSYRVLAVRDRVESRDPATLPGLRRLGMPLVIQEGGVTTVTLTIKSSR